VPQLRRDGAYDRFKIFSFPKLNAAVSVQAGRYMKCVYEVDGATMEYVFPPHSQHGEIKFRNRSYDLLRFTELRM
jgi:hypothetical protein